MPSWFQLPTLLFFCAFAALVAPLRAQPEMGTVSETSYSSSQQDDLEDGSQERPRVQGADLKTYYLLRENGELAPYFDIPFEEFERIYRLYRGIDQAERPNRYSVSQFSVDARVDGEQVELDVSIAIRANVDGWVRVPLLLNDCSLRAPQSKADSNVAFLSVADDGEGLVCWLEGKRGEETELRLALIKRLDPNNGGRRISIKSPPAAFSRMMLDVPNQDAVGVPNDEATLQQTNNPSPGWTRFTILGKQSGGFDFGWASRSADEAMETRYVVSSQTSLLVETERQVRLQSIVHVDGGGTPVESIRVLLPQNAQLLPSSTGEFIVGEADATDENDVDALNSPTTQARKVVVVRAVDPSTEAEGITINAIVNWEDVASAEMFDIPMLEVEDAIQQSGRLDLFAESREWVIDWEMRGGLKRDTLPASDVGEGIPIAGFAFSRNGGILSLKSERQPTRIDIEPVVTMSATRNEIQMDATYRVTVTGTPPSQLMLDVDSWELNSISSPTVLTGIPLSPSVESAAPQDLVRSFEPSADDPKRMQVNLNSENLDGRNTFLLRIQGRVDLSAGLRQVDLTIPTVVDAAISTTTLLVRQAESLVIRPERTSLQPVPTSTIPDWFEVEQATQPDAVYRGLLALDRATVPFVISVRPRSVSYRTRLDARIVEQSIQVQTSIDLDVKNQPLRELDLLVPRVVFEYSDLIVRTESGESVFTAADVSSANDTLMASVPLEFEDGLLGQTNLVFEYQMPFSMVSQGDGLDERSAEIEIEIPLVQLLLERTPVPLAGSPVPIVSPLEMIRSMIENQQQHRFLEAEITHPLVFDVQPDSGEWERLGVEEVAGLLVSSFNSSQPKPDGILRFRVRSVDHRSASLVEVQKSWVQTQLTSDNRQDRAVFRFQTGLSWVRVRLPENASFLQVALNNVSVKNPRVEAIDGRVYVSVATPSQSIDAPNVLEVWYRFSDRPSLTEPLVMEWPVMEGALWIDRAYWQLILPKDEHLASFGDGFTAEHDWVIDSFLFGRKSRMNQAALEDWIGVDAQTDAGHGGNVYLFSSFGDIESTTVSFVDRRLLLLVVCTVTFLFGVLLIYLKSIRSPLVLTALAAVLVAVAFVQLELAILIAQLVLVAGVFVAVTMLLRAVMTRPFVPIATTSRREVESSSTVTRTANTQDFADSKPSVEEELLTLSSHSES